MGLERLDGGTYRGYSEKVLKERLLRYILRVYPFILITTSVIIKYNIIYKSLRLLKGVAFILFILFK